MKALRTETRRQTLVVSLGLVTGLPLAVLGVVQPAAPEWAPLVIGAGVATLLAAAAAHLRALIR